MWILAACFFAAITAEARLASGEPPATDDGAWEYFVIPVEGEIGLYVTADLVRKCLDAVQRPEDTVVILKINSGGGDAREGLAIAEVLRAYRKRGRLVAYVEEAISAAAFIAMSCPEIIVTTDANIGGCVVYRLGPKGTPENIEEKFQSIYRSEMRGIAEGSGHAGLIMEGMMRADLKLSLRDRDGVVEVIEGDGDKVLKSAGRILTLTSNEAVGCGLAVGTADSIAESNGLLGIRNWRKQSDIGVRFCQTWRNTLTKQAKFLNVLWEDRLEKVVKINNYIERLPSTRQRTLKHLNELSRKINKIERILDDYPMILSSPDIIFLREDIDELRTRISEWKDILETR